MNLMIVRSLLCGLLFFLGACIYSCLNVVIYRVSKKESFGRGKSRYCKRRIGVRDALITLLGGVTLLYCMYQFETIGKALTIFAFFAILTFVTFLDIDTMEIADGCHLAILSLAVVSWFTMEGPGIGARLSGALCVSLPLLLITLVIPGAFGGGDIKLMAACGLFLGWKITLISTFLGFFFGGIWAAGLLLTGKAERKETFAFGPFLCLGMTLGLLYGQAIIFI